MERLKTDYAIVVEGRDDVAAVSGAVDALVIPTHGFGITAETWGMIEKAYKEKGLIILTDPDHAGEKIRQRLTERFPGALQAYVSREVATAADDIGIENAKPGAIAEAIGKALGRAEKDKSGDHAASKEAPERIYADMADLRDLGLAGKDGASELRAEAAAALGIGYGNAAAFVKKLRGFGISLDELKEEIEKIRKQQEPRSEA